MKTAFATWENRIAPVFDVARTIYLIEAEAGRMVQETHAHLPEDAGLFKVLRLVDLEVDTLVCGAISRPLEAMVAAYGIRVVPFVSGELGRIVQAYLDGGLAAKEFGMPGCAPPRWRLRGRHGFMHKEKMAMNGKKSGGRGQGGGGQGGGGMGQGGGRGRGGQKAGRMGGVAAGPQGFCVCPQCGQREAHQRSVPCYERKCAKCGAALIRE